MTERSYSSTLSTFVTRYGRRRGFRVCSVLLVFNQGAILAFLFSLQMEGKAEQRKDAKYLEACRQQGIESIPLCVSVGGFIYISIYLFKQAFSIPGSVLLNMLYGAMFGDWPGFALVCVLTACGTSCCYIISSLFGKRLADRLFGAKIPRVQKAIDNHRANLFLYLLVVARETA